MSKLDAFQTLSAVVPAYPCDYIYPVVEANGNEYVLFGVGWKDESPLDISQMFRVADYLDAVESKTDLKAVDGDPLVVVPKGTPMSAFQTYATIQGTKGPHNIYAMKIDSSFERLDASEVATRAEDELKSILSHM